MINHARVSIRQLPLLAAATVSLVLPAAQPALAETVRNDEASLGKELKLPIYQWLDEKTSTKGLVVALHGVTLHAKRFDALAGKLATDGFAVYALDLRGFGKWKTEYDKYADGDNKIHYTQSQQDLLEVLRALRRMYPDLPIYLLGESLGANMAVWAASTHSDLLDGIILSSPCVKRILRFNGRVLVDATKGLMHPYKEFELEPHISPYLSEDPRVTEEYLNDPAIDRSLSPADLIKSVKTNTLTLAWTRKIPEDLPVLILAGKQDKIYKAKAIPSFARKIPSKSKTIYIFEDKGHLLLEHQYVSQEVMARIDEWLQTRQKRDPKKGEIAENDEKAILGEGARTTDSGTP